MAQFLGSSSDDPTGQVGLTIIWIIIIVIITIIIDSGCTNQEQQQQHEEQIPIQSGPTTGGPTTGTPPAIQAPPQSGPQQIQTSPPLYLYQGKVYRLSQNGKFPVPNNGLIYPGDDLYKPELEMGRGTSTQESIENQDQSKQRWANEDARSGSHRISAISNCSER